MRVLLYWEGPVLIARVSQMDAVDANREAFQIISEAVPLHVVVDCSQVGFIASTGIANLVKLVQHIRRYGGHVRLASVTPAVERVLEMVNLTRWVAMAPSVRDAVELARPKNVA